MLSTLQAGMHANHIGAFKKNVHHWADSDRAARDGSGLCLLANTLL